MVQQLHINEKCRVEVLEMSVRILDSKSQNAIRQRVKDQHVNETSLNVKSQLKINTGPPFEDLRGSTCALIYAVQENKASITED